MFPKKVRFWGWSENKREEEMDLKELRERAAQGLPLYGTSHQPDWVQQAANSNSQWSQLKFCEYYTLYLKNLYLIPISTSYLSNVSIDMLVSLPFIYTIQLGLISYNIPTTAPTQQSTA